MHAPLILKISALLLFGGLPFVHARDRVDSKEEAREDRKNSGASISSSQNGDRGTVTYNGKEVWKGKVEDGLSTAASSVNGKSLAAAWDGKKLVWESEKGAGAALQAQQKKGGKKDQPA